MADREMEDGRLTVDGDKAGFPACQGERAVNEWGTNKRMGAADGGRTASPQGRLSGLSEEKPLTAEGI